MKRISDLCIRVILILTAFLLVMSGLHRRNEEMLVSRIAPEILRFHVIANSDSAEDQELKLEVKDLLLKEIRTLTETQKFNDNISNIDNEKDFLIHLILTQKLHLESVAETYMTEHHFPYHADIQIESCEFPEKTYGDMTFPAGTYDAVRVILGDGRGQNFWCVLYPSLCYLDSTYAIVPDSSKEQLQSLISEDDFHALLSARKGKKNPEQDNSLPRLKIRFKLCDFFE